MAGIAAAAIGGGAGKFQPAIAGFGPVRADAESDDAPSLRGGQGSIVGTILGALLLAVLANGTVLLNVSGFWQRVIVGGVVLVAVLVDLLRRRGN